MQKFAKKYWVILLIIALLAAPFLIATLIEICNKNFSSNGLNPASWFAFWSCYLGGVATMIAVIMTMKSNQKFTNFQVKTDLINKEKAYVSEALLKINIRFFISSLLKAEGMHKVTSDFEFAEISEFIAEVNQQKENVYKANTLLQLNTDILNFKERCDDCASQCKLFIHSKKFSDSFKKIQEELTQSSDLIINHMLLSNQSDGKKAFSLGSGVKSTLDIKECSTKLDELYNNEYQDLIVSAKIYYVERFKHNGKKCGKISTI